MDVCFFVTDLHGNQGRYLKLFGAIEKETPAAVFLGGDLFPSGLGGLLGVREYEDFLEDLVVPGFGRIKEALGPCFPSIFIILGNDDARTEEARIQEHENRLLWTYAHNRCIPWRARDVYGYSYVPPTPFLLKDWERYDVSSYLDPLCIAPEHGCRSVEIPENVLRHETILEHLQLLTGDKDLSRAIFLFHAPPYECGLDRAALDGKRYEHVNLDVHVGSIAIRRFIETRQPWLTLHGHVHESARITGVWKERIGRTVALSAAHDGPELALVRFDPENPWDATRELL